MSTSVQGLHHITALASHPNPNIEFYAGVLGLRLVKISVNPDDPGTYQLFYGNETGRPGTILSFYCSPHLPPKVSGRGWAQTVGLAIPKNSLGYWRKRLKKFGVSYTKEKERFEERFIGFSGPDGLNLELVSTQGDNRPPFVEGPTDPAHAILGLHHVNLSLLATTDIQEFLTKYVGFKQVVEAGNRQRFAPPIKSENFVDISAQPELLTGKQGLGGIHHLAFLLQKKEDLNALQKRLIKNGWNTGLIQDRTYFHSFFFPAGEGLIIEIATAAPGFSVDEPLENLGTSLQVPQALASERKSLEKSLPKLVYKLEKYR